jgi:hypothetical protein
MQLNRRHCSIRAERRTHSFSQWDRSRCLCSCNSSRDPDAATAFAPATAAEIQMLQLHGAGKTAGALSRTDDSASAQKSGTNRQQQPVGAVPLQLTCLYSGHCTWAHEGAGSTCGGHASRGSQLQPAPSTQSGKARATKKRRAKISTAADESRTRSGETKSETTLQVALRELSIPAVLRCKGKLLEQHLRTAGIESSLSANCTGD